MDLLLSRRHYLLQMRGRTLKWLTVAAVLAIAACAEGSLQTSDVEPALPDMEGWRMASGKAPTKAEFTALAATCQAKGGAVDACLTELGLKRTP